MLVLRAGLVVAGGAALARSVGSLVLPLVFVAIGAPFIALALGNHQLLFNVSSSSGKIFAGVFGGCFVIAGLIAIAAGVSGAIGKTTAPTSVQVAPGVTVLSAAAERARQISFCKDLVAGERLIGAREKVLLIAECNTNWKAAEHQLPAAARRGALAYAAAQCKQQTQQAGSAAGLPASAGSTLARALAAASGNPATSSRGTGLESLQAELCQQIVKAQVPAAALQQALAACPKS